MQRLVKIRRYRFTDEMSNVLLSLGKYGKNESRFVREAITDKIKKDLPILQKELDFKNDCPF